MNSFDFASTIAAWIGALGTVTAAGWAIFTWRKARNHVVVSSTNAFLISQDGSPSDAMICIKAVNLGLDPVTVTGWGVQVLRGNIVSFRDDPGSTRLPARLQTNESASFYMESMALREYERTNKLSFKKMRPYVHLASGKTIRSKKGIPLK